MFVCQPDRTVGTEEGLPISSFQIKLVACAAMLIDHLGALFLVLYPQYIFFVLFRVVGRISFPLFAFIAANAALHTRNIGNYAKRLFLFALLSEIPFNLFMNLVTNEPVSIYRIQNQNVLFTFAAGIFAVMLYNEAKAHEKMLAKVLLIFAVILTFCATAYCKTDYGVTGVLIILTLYIIMSTAKIPDKHRKAAVLCVMIIASAFLGTDPITQIAALCSIVFIALYKNQKGRSFRWAFYMFYPVHFLVLTLIGTRI